MLEARDLTGPGRARWRRTRFSACGRKAGQWLVQHRGIAVPFNDAAAFANLNTADELRAADGSGR